MNHVKKEKGKMKGKVADGCTSRVEDVKKKNVTKIVIYTHLIDVVSWPVEEQ